MAQTQQIKTIRARTHEHLDIEDITHNIVILKDGSGCLIMQASTINFSLLSEGEQEAIIYAYAAILNSLTYPIQVLIQSERKDISDYLHVIKAEESKQSDKIIKEHIRRYRRFVEETVQKNNVLDKKFYIVVPFTTLELGAPKALAHSIAGSKKLPFPKDYIVEQALNHLNPKRDHLIRQFSRLGIRLRQLSTAELIELFYHAYHPDFSEGVHLDIAKSYTAPITTAAPEVYQKISQFIQQSAQPPTNQSSTQPTSSPPATQTPVETPSPANNQPTINTPPSQTTKQPSNQPFTPPTNSQS